MPRHQAESPSANRVSGLGGPRSEATRRTILEVARRLFAAHGFERTTVRAVAAQAGIDPSMVMRYFGSKEGLFAAAATSHLQVPDLGPVAASKRGECMVRHFVDRWERNPEDDSLVFLLRTAVTNSDVAQQLQVNFNRLITEPVAAIGLDQADRRGALIGTQLLGLALCRYVLGLQPITGAAVEDVIADIAPSVQLQLERGLADAKLGSAAARQARAAS